jgi:transcription elongation factor GreA
VRDILVTREGLDRLNAELGRLRAERHSLAERITRALEHGGAFPENGEYNAVRHEQELLDRRIAVLERRLHAAELVEPETDGEVDIGEVVRVRDLTSKEMIEYRIVGTGEGDPAAGDVSHESPVGAALLGRRVGQTVDVAVPDGVVRLQVVHVHG